MKRWLYVMIYLSAFTFSLKADFLDFESQKALKEKKLILLTIGSEQCPYCVKMKKEIFETHSYRTKISKKYVHVEMLYNDPMLPQSLHVKYLPTHYVLAPKDLRILDEFAGYSEASHFLELLDEVYQQEVK